MESLLKSLAKSGDKVNLIRYADDFVITGSSRELLEGKIKPALTVFLSERGLSLSAEKTHITHIRDGFDFLGFNIRKYKGKLLTKPSKKNVLTFLTSIREIIKTGKGKSAVELLRQLNPKIRGWANYYRHGVSKETFQYVDSQIFEAIWRWCKCRHPNKNQTWVKEKYFTSQGNRKWVMTAKFRNKDGEWRTFSLVEASYVPIVRHIKIKAEANPYDARYANYFEQRSKKNKGAIFSIEPYSGYH